MGLLFESNVFYLFENAFTYFIGTILALDEIYGRKKMPYRISY